MNDEDCHHHLPRGERRGHTRGSPRGHALQVEGVPRRTNNKGRYAALPQGKATGRRQDSSGFSLVYGSVWGDWGEMAEVRGQIIIGSESERPKRQQHVRRDETRDRVRV